MLSFASAAFLADKTLLSTFAANLEILLGASAHPQTMALWQTQPEAWTACRRDLQPPEIVMPRYVAWLKALPGQPVFVAYPATYDFMFVYWYLIRFAGESPFAHHGLDVRTYAMTLLKIGYKQAGKDHTRQPWFDPMHIRIRLSTTRSNSELRALPQHFW